MLHTWLLCDRTNLLLWDQSYAILDLRMISFDWDSPEQNVYRNKHWKGKSKFDILKISELYYYYILFVYRIFYDITMRNNQILQYVK